MVSTLEQYILDLLDRLKDKRLFQIRDLLSSGIQVLPVVTLKEYKEAILNLSTSASDLFFDAAVFYYAKFIQSIQVTDLAQDERLIPHYLKTIGIVKKIDSGNPLCKVNFDPFLKIISDHIENTLLAFERFEKVIECLQIPKIIDNKEFAKIKKNKKILKEVEELLLNNYLIMADMRKKYQIKLFSTEGPLSKDASPYRNENNEGIDINFIKNALALSKPSTIEDHPEANPNAFFDDFGNRIGPVSFRTNTIVASETPSSVQEFSPIFESHFIGHINQFKLWDKPIFAEFNHKYVYPAVCLLNQKQVCVKIYQDYYPKTIEQWETRLELVKSLSEKGKIHLKYFGSFVNGQDYYLIIELCRNNLWRLIDSDLKFSNSDLAYFVYSLIKGLYEIKIDENPYHVDIKPSNILITYDNEFRIRDYKTTERYKVYSVDAGNHGFIYKITWEYWGPEMCNLNLSGEEYLNKWELSDVYSLGLVILEMSGSKFIAEHRRNRKLFYKKLRKQQSLVDIPWLSRLLECMLAENMEDRPSFENLLAMIESDQEFMKDKESYIQSWAKKEEFKRMHHWIKFR